MSPSQLHFLVPLLFLLKHVHSQCSNLSPISSICGSDGYCLINSNSHCTCGQIPWNQDIAFIFDSSMTSNQWASATQFASDLLYYGSPSLSTTRAAIFQTSYASTPSTITLSFDSEPISNTITPTLPNLQQTPQTSFYLQLSLQNALQLFNTSSASNTRKILIIFATQEFSQAPCKINMRSNEIYTYIIAIGAFNKYPLTCIGSSDNNYEGLISIDNILQLPNILTKMESITCPHNPLIKITEIQLEGINGQQSLEIYNYGHGFDTAQLKLFGVDRSPSNSLPSLQFNQGAFLVVYNTDDIYVRQQSIPNCINCQCNENSLTQSYPNIKWCQNAIYIGCCNSCANNYGFETIADCQFSDELLMTTFYVGLIWTNPNTQIRQLMAEVNVDIINVNQDWSQPTGNYSFEINNIGFNNQFGSSWTIPCDLNGTSGDQHQLNTNICKNNLLLNCAEGYYQYYQTCLPLPMSDSCIAVEQGSSASITTYNIAKWDGDTTYLFYHCDISANGCNTLEQYSKTVTSLLTYTVFDQGSIFSDVVLNISDSIFSDNSIRTDIEFASSSNGQITMDNCQFLGGNTQSYEYSLYLSHLSATTPPYILYYFYSFVCVVFFVSF